MHVSSTQHGRPRSRGLRIALIIALLLVPAWAWTAGIPQQEKPAPAKKPAADGAGEKKAAPEKKAEPEPEIPLVEQEPFDLITLTAANNGVQLKVVPINGGARKAPFRPNAGSKYRIRLIEEDEDEYELQGSSIAKVELYEELLMREARQLTNAGKLDEAFEYFYLIKANYPELPGLENAINDFLYQDAYTLITEKRWAEALAIVEDLREQRPDYRTAELQRFLDRLVDKLIDSFVAAGEYRAARSSLLRIREKYGATKPASIDRWSEQLAAMAAERLDLARKHLSDGEFRDAISASREMMYIWPDVDGGRELNAELSQQYPMVAVGVMQPAKTHESQRLDNWSARRTGRLVDRYLVEFLGAGPEGGQYDFPLGLIERTDNRRGMILRLNRLSEETASLTGYELSRRLLQLADSDAPDYLPAWSALVDGASVQDVLEVDVELRRPHVLPEALLRVPMFPPAPSANPDELPTGSGPFAVTLRTDKEVRFATKGFQAGDRLAEIVELTFDDPLRALAALRRGDVDVLDRLFPADALRLRDEFGFESRIQIEPYALPTVHMLVPNSEKNPFLENRDFRRAILFAIDRQRILRQELLGNRDVMGCRVISGPFPAGAGDADPLGYAYDASIRPRRYDPRLAKLLTIVSQRQVAEMAEKRGDPEPKLEALVIGHPSHELARVACQAIAGHLKVIGLDSTLKEFPPGICRDVDGECDLVYTEIAIWEPVVDAVRLLGTRGPAVCNSPYVQQALRWLNGAQSWGEVRERLLEVHSAVHNEVAILPLWQMVDFFAYDKRIRNVGEDPVWLYQHIDQWRLGNETAE